MSELFPADENTDLIPRVVLARRRHGMMWLAGGGVALVIFGATWFANSTPRVDDAVRAKLDADARFIASSLDASARAARGRALHIAQSTMVKAVILTDAATAIDMAGSDFDHTPIHDERLVPGETLELFQVRGGQAASLVRFPQNAAPVPLDPIARVDNAGSGDLDIVVSTPVEKYAGASDKPDVTGALAMRIPVALGQIREYATKDAWYVELTGVGAPITLVSSPVTEPRITVPLHTDPASRFAAMQLVVVPKAPLVAPGWLRVLRYAALALAVGLLAVAARLLLRR